MTPKELIDLIDADGEGAKSIVAPEDAEVKAICERIGYGAVMDSAARQWFLKDNVAALTVGPCAYLIRAAKQTRPK